MVFDEYDDWDAAEKKQKTENSERCSPSSTQSSSIFEIITDLMTQILNSVDSDDLEQAIEMLRKIRALLDENCLSEESQELLDSLKQEISSPELQLEITKAKTKLDEMQREIKAKKVKIEEKIRNILSYKGIHEYQKAKDALNEAKSIAESIGSEENLNYLSVLSQEIETAEWAYTKKKQQETINKKVKKIQESYANGDYELVLTEAAQLKEFLSNQGLETDSTEIDTIINDAQDALNKKQTLMSQYTELYDSIENDIASSNYISAIEKCNSCIALAKELNLGSEKIDTLNELKNEMMQALSAQKSTLNLENAKNIIESIKLQISEKKFDDAEQNIESLKEYIKAEEIKDIKIISQLETLTKEFSQSKENYKKNEDLFRKLYKDAEGNFEQKKYLPALENLQICLRIAQDMKFSKNETKELEKKITEIETLLHESRNKKMEEKEKILKTLETVEAIMGTEKDVLPDIMELSIQDSIGNISDDLESMMTALNNVLETQRVEIKNDITSKSVLKSKSGETIELERKTKVVETEETRTTGEIGEEGDRSPEQKPKGPVKITVTSGLENPLDDVIEEAILQDVIPYNFEVTEFHVDGIELDKDPEKEMTKDGLQYTWVFKDLEPKQKVEINYDLRRRVSRTVIIPVQDQLKVIKTHSNLEFLNVEGLYDAKLKFINRFGESVKGIVIEDIIPLYYLYNIKYPDNQKPKDIEKSNNGALIKWNIKEFDKEQVAIHQYRLMEIYKFEDLKIITKKDSKRAIQLVKQSKLQESNDVYSTIIKRLAYYQ